MIILSSFVVTFGALLVIMMIHWAIATVLDSSDARWIVANQLLIGALVFVSMGSVLFFGYRMVVKVLQ